MESQPGEVELQDSGATWQLCPVTQLWRTALLIQISVGTAYKKCAGSSGLNAKRCLTPRSRAGLSSAGASRLGFVAGSTYRENVAEHPHRGDGTPIVTASCEAR